MRQNLTLAPQNIRVTQRSGQAKLTRILSQQRGSGGVSKPLAILRPVGRSVPDDADHPPVPSSSLSGWGRLAVPGRELRSEDLEHLTDHAALTRGLARSYGDSSLPAPGELTVVA